MSKSYHQLYSGIGSFPNLRPPLVGKAVRRVLVYRIGSLGDTIVSLPCLHLIARVFPAAQRVLLTNFAVNAKAPAASAVLENSGLIHAYMRYSVATRNPLELLRLWWNIMRFRPEVLVYLMPQRSTQAVKRDTFFFRLAGVRHIVGLPDFSQPFHVLDPDTGLFQRESARLAKSIAALGDAGPEAREHWDLRLTSEETNTAARILSIFRNAPLLVCGPGTKQQSKDWGSHNWHALLNRLSAAFPAHGLVFVGAKEDAAIAGKLTSAWSEKVLDLCGQISPRETAAVIGHARLFLGPDSGPMHLAALMGVPCVIAFSAQGKAGAWFPIGSNNHILYHKTDCAGCGLATCIERQQECLRLISVDEMYAAASDALQFKSE